MRRVLFLVTCFVTLSAVLRSVDFWQPAVLTPAAPTSRDSIKSTFAVFFPCSAGSATTSVSGSVVRTTQTCSDNYPPLPTGYIDVSTVFGPLPAGDYTYEIYTAFPGGQERTYFRSRQPLHVTAASDVPALSKTTLAVLAALLVLCAFVVLRK